MTVSLLRGNALALPIADGTVDLIVCSPPYFGQRSYQDGGVHYPGQLGSEATPAEFITALVAATREMVRVLKPSGSIWVNLSDKYASNGRAERNTTGVPAKSLMGIPFRYVLACIDDLGLIFRRDQIWDKTNHMPESATDRCATAHEYLFHFVKQPHYFSAVDEIREVYNGDRALSRRIKLPGVGKREQRAVWTQDNPLGKLPGSVWSIPTQPLVVPPELGIDHYAAYPFELCRRIIAGWSPCGGVVADPFGGTGTTALVAHVMGRRGISVDMSADYTFKVARWRTTDPDQLAAAAQVEKPPRQVTGQESLFDGFDPPAPKTRNGAYPERDCQNCGHRSGSTTMNCPECGARKREAGVAS